MDVYLHHQDSVSIPSKFRVCYKCGVELTPPLSLQSTSEPINTSQMPASPSPSLLDDAHPRSYDPLSSQRRLPKLTPARLTFFAATLGLGIPKAVTSAEGQETVTNILNLNLGVVWPCV